MTDNTGRVCQGEAEVMLQMLRYTTVHQSTRMLVPLLRIRPPSRCFALLLVIALASCGGGSSDPVGREMSPDEANAAAAAWQAEHEADYRRDWVTIAGLHMLKPGPNTAGGAAGNDIVLPPPTPPRIGRFDRDGDRVHFEPEPGVRVLLDDRPVTQAIELKDDRTREVDELVVGDIRVVVHVSGDRRSLRVRDPNGPLARGFLGFSWFQIDARYRVIGRMIRDETPTRLQVVNTYGDVDTYTSEGVVEFTLEGQTLRLRPFTTRPGRLYFVFSDASSGQETYKVARFLYSDLRGDGTTVLDFNTAYNPPCAFNPYTTCPIPLRENRLPVKILAGEKAYPVDVAVPDTVEKTSRP